jgi:hypothetical protein
MKFGNNSYENEYRRDELLSIISRSLEQLTLSELEALYYDMTTKNFIKDDI